MSQSKFAATRTNREPHVKRRKVLKDKKLFTDCGMSKKLCQVETPSEIWGQRIERQVNKITKDKLTLLAS